MESQAVVGGTNVTQLQNSDTAFPYGTTVRFLAPADNDNTARFPRSTFSQPSTCSGVKIGPRRYLTAAHCVHTWNGSSTGQVYITNDPTLASLSELDASFRYTVTRVRVHPSWLLGQYASDGFPDQSGRGYDVGLFEVSQSNSIPQMVANNAVKVNSADITNGWISRLVGYGSQRKAWADNTAVSLSGNVANMDETALPFTHFLWQGPPTGEPGDSGAPVFNSLSGGWWISGIVSGPVFNQQQTRIGRLEPLINWIRSPAAPPVVNGQHGYLINGAGPHCLDQGSSNTVMQTACSAATSTTDRQYWTLDEGSPGFYRLRNGQTGKCVAATGSTAGTNLVQQACDTSNTNNFQKWYFLDRGRLDPDSGDTASGYRVHMLVNIGSGHCMAPAGSSRSHGALMSQQTCVSFNEAYPQSSVQAWVLVR